jgi:DNA-binding XRE family transcriptional regulator
MMAPLDPKQMTLVLEVRRDWWVMTAALERRRGNEQLETLAMEIAAMFDDAITRVRLVEHRMDAQLRELFWRDRGNSTTHPAS